MREGVFHVGRGMRCTECQSNVCIHSCVIMQKKKKLLKSNQTQFFPVPAISIYLSIHMYHVRADFLCHVHCHDQKLLSSYNGIELFKSFTDKTGYFTAIVFR